jgi:hypothetical protein
MLAAGSPSDTAGSRISQGNTGVVFYKCKTCMIVSTHSAPLASRSCTLQPCASLPWWMAFSSQSPIPVLAPFRRHHPAWQLQECGVQAGRLSG